MPDIKLITENLADELIPSIQKASGLQRALEALDTTYAEGYGKATRQFSRPLYHRNIGGHRLPGQSYRSYCLSANTIRCIPKQEGDNYCEP